MSEATVVYEVNQVSHVRVQKRWLGLLYRLATLKGGQVYTITLILPDKPDGDPQWAITAGAKVENGG